MAKLDNSPAGIIHGGFTHLMNEIAGPPPSPIFRAQVSIRANEYAIIDSVTRIRYPCENEAKMWAKFDQIQGLV